MYLFVPAVRGGGPPCLLGAPQWVRSFQGARIVVPEEAQGVHWAGGIEADSIQKAALTARRLAEGQSMPQRRARSGWMIVVYVAAALFGIELLLVIFGSVASSFMR